MGALYSQQLYYTQPSLVNGVVILSIYRATVESGV